MGPAEDKWLKELQEIAKRQVGFDPRDGTSSSNKVEEEVSAFSERLAEDRESLELKSLEQDIEARKTYGKSIFRMVQVWLIGVFLLLVFQGFFSVDDRESYVPFFRLDSSVLIAVVSGTTASVIGIFVIVANYFFPKKGP